MTHPLVAQLRFTRSEWLRALEDVTPEEGVRRFEPMNCISWIIGHLAWQEQRHWLEGAQGRIVAPELEVLVAYGGPATTPPLEKMWDAWREVVRESDRYLDTVTTDILLTRYERDGKPYKENFGTIARRITYHYWFHMGESQAIRQLLGHQDLPRFVGDIPLEATYLPERAATP